MSNYELRRRLLAEIGEIVAPIGGDWIDGEHTCEGAEQKETPFFFVDGYAYRWGWYPETGLLHFAGLNPRCYEPSRHDLLPLTEPMPLTDVAAPLLNDDIASEVISEPNMCMWHSLCDRNRCAPVRDEEHDYAIYTFGQARERAVAVSVEMLLQRASGS